MWLATFGHFVGLAIEIILVLAQCEHTINEHGWGSHQTTEFQYHFWTKDPIAVVNCN